MNQTITSPTITGRIEQIEYMVQTDHVVIQENEACGSQSDSSAESSSQPSPDSCLPATRPTSQDRDSDTPAWKAKCRVVECGYGYDIRCGKWYWIEVVGKWEDINEPGIEVDIPTYSQSRLNEAIRDMQDITTPPQDWKEPCSTSSSSSQPPTPSTASPSASGSSSGACSTSRLRDAGEVADEVVDNAMTYGSAFPLRSAPTITSDRIATLEWASDDLLQRGYLLASRRVRDLISKLKGQP